MTAPDDRILAEIRRLRADVAALTTGDHPAQHMWLPGLRSSHVVLPVMHYRLTAWLRRRLRLPGKTTADPARRQQRIALGLTVFAAVRTAAWVACMALIAAHWAGAGGPFLTSFTALSGSVIFVTFISFYCNAATDAASLVAGIAALFAAQSRATALAAGSGVTAVAGDVTALEADVARLAGLQPGDEAQALAGDIRRRITRDQRTMRTP